MRLRSVIVVATFLLMHQDASAAETFACGPGGKPNATTTRCDCPVGKIEQTSNGTSRCVNKTIAPTLTPKPPAAPSCPPGTVSHQGVCTSVCAADETWNGTACEAKSKPVVCEEGRVADAAGHCCFPGQAWGDESARCRGKPICPKGFAESDETCVLQCDDGMIAAKSGTHCCWPGQEWSSATGTCVGEPACPPSFEREGETCVHHATPEVEKTATANAIESSAHDEASKRVRDRAWLRGVGSASFLGLSYTYATTPSGAHLSYGDWALNLHTPDFPLFVHAGLGTGRLTGNGTSRFAHVVFGAAFAPLSLPNAAETSPSWFNPSIGLAYHRFFSADQGATLDPAPGSFGALTFEIANTISIIQRLEPHHNGVGISVRFGYARGLLSGDYAPSSGFFIAANLSAFADSW